VPVRVQRDDFDLGREVAALVRGNHKIGAVVSFVGLVRDTSDGAGIASMTLEHYPGMTEKSLEEILREARSRWNIFDALVIHRYGMLAPGDQIVLVVVAGAHRGDAFAACEFIMDYLKTRAPFWKKEETAEGARWVQAHPADDSAAARWGKDKPA